MAKQRTASDKYVIAGGGFDGTGAIWTPVAVDASGGYDKALFICGRGAELGTGSQFSASVYESATTGGTYALRSGSLGTSAVTKPDTALLIEIAVAAATPFLKLHGTASTTGTASIPVVAVAQLYRGTRTLPPSPSITVISA